MKTCPKCQTQETDEHAFCSNCGAQMGEESPYPMPENFIPADGKKELKHIRSARIAIMAVAVFTLIGAIYLWVELQSEIDKISRDLYMVVDNEVVTQTRIVIAATFILGLIFIGLYFWAKKNPFGASLTALIIYITNIIVAAGLDPKSLMRGIIVKGIIIGALIGGVKSGLEYRKLKEIPGQIPND